MDGTMQLSGCGLGILRGTEPKRWKVEVGSTGVCSWLSSVVCSYVAPKIELSVSRGGSIDREIRISDEGYLRDLSRG